MKFILALLILMTPVATFATAYLETGVIDTYGDISKGNWKTIKLKYKYKDPIVVVGPSTSANPNPVVARVRNITSQSIEIGLQSICLSVGTCNQNNRRELISYFVIERGTWQFNSGVIITADKIRTKRAATFNKQKYKKITLPALYSQKPAVLHSVSSTNDISFTSSAMNNYVKKGDNFTFDLALELGETSTKHDHEEIHYFAATIGKYNLRVGSIQSGLGFAEKKDSNICNTYSSLGFIFFKSILASPNSRTDDDGGFLRICTKWWIKAGAVIDEDTVMDSERGGTGEEISMISFVNGTSGEVEVPECAVDTLKLTGNGNGLACDNIPVTLSARPFCSKEQIYRDDWVGRINITPSEGSVSRSSLSFNGTGTPIEITWTSLTPTEDAKITAKIPSVGSILVEQPETSFSPDGFLLETDTTQCDQASELKLTAYGKQGKSCEILTDINGIHNVTISSNASFTIDNTQHLNSGEIPLSFNRGIATHPFEINSHGTQSLFASMNYGLATVTGSLTKEITPDFELTPNFPSQCDQNDKLCSTKLITGRDYPFNIGAVCNNQPVAFEGKDDLNITSKIMFPTSCDNIACDNSITVNLNNLNNGIISPTINFKDAGNHLLELTYKGDTVAEALIGTLIPSDISAITNQVSFSNNCGYIYVNEPKFNTALVFETLNEQGVRTTNFNGEFSMATPNNEIVYNSSPIKTVEALQSWADGVIDLSKLNQTIKENEVGLESYDDSIVITNFSNNESIKLIDSNYRKSTYSTCTLGCDSYSTNAFDIKAGRAYLPNATGSFTQDVYATPYVEWVYDGVFKKQKASCEYINSLAPTKSSDNIGTYNENITKSSNTDNSVYFTYPKPTSINGTVIQFESSLNTDSHLKWDWNNDGNKTSPSNSVTFGNYKKDKKVISWKEQQ